MLLYDDAPLPICPVLEHEFRYGLAENFAVPFQACCFEAEILRAPLQLLERCCCNVLLSQARCAAIQDARIGTSEAATTAISIDQLG